MYIHGGLKDLKGRVDSNTGLSQIWAVPVHPRRACPVRGRLDLSIPRLESEKKDTAATTRGQSSQVMRR